MGPLQGIKVVELAQWIAAPGAAAIMSDWGADVIKIEEPAGGDALRGYAETRSDYPKMEINAPFELDNRNKKSVAINLRHKLGQEITYQLVKGADIFLTNFMSKALKKLNMDYESLSHVNPRLIYAELTGYGDVGPDKDQPGFDRSAYFARSGMQDILREPEAPPPCMRPAFGDRVVAGFMVATIMAALWYREREGVAQRVSLSLLHCGIWQLGTDVQVSLVSGKDIPRATRHAPGNVLTNHYQTKDGRWIVLAMPTSDRYWPEFCKAIDREDLERNPSYKNHQLRAKNSASLVSLLDEIFATRAYSQWKEAFERHGIVYGLIQTTGEAASDPQAWATDVYTSVKHPVSGDLKLITSPGKFDKTPCVPKAPAPELGQHTEQILLEIGYTWDDIAKFKEQKVII